MPTNAYLLISGGRLGPGFVDFALRLEGAEDEGKRHVMDFVDETVLGFALDDNIADVAAFGDGSRIQGGILTGLPTNDEICFFDAPVLPEDIESPGLVSDNHQPCHRRHVFGQGAAEQEWPSGGVLSDIGVGAIAPERTGGIEHKAVGKPFLKTAKGFHPGRQHL